jgi:acetyl esterase/lipase
MRIDRRALYYWALASIFFIAAYTEPTFWFFRFANAGTPHNGYEAAQNIAYGALPRQRLDVYVPKNGKNSRETLVYIHGGYWVSGSRKQYGFIGKALSEMGYIAVIPDYHLYPAARYPQFLHDTAQAARWAHENAARFGGDPDAIYLIGHSAGAYNVLMSALDPRFLSENGKPPAWLRGVIAIAGLYDFLPVKQNIAKIFGPSLPAETQPAHFVNNPAPPLLLITGDQDTVVDPKNTTELAKKLKAAGNPVEMIVYPNVNHYWLLMALTAKHQHNAPVRRDVQAFIEKH